MAKIEDSEHVGIWLSGYENTQLHVGLRCLPLYYWYMTQQFGDPGMLLLYVDQHCLQATQRHMGRSIFCGWSGAVDILVDH